MHFSTYPFFAASVGVLAAFIASLYSKHYARATLMTYMSALSYIHKLAGTADPTQICVIKTLLAGAQKLLSKPDTRLPISPSILHKLSMQHKLLSRLPICIICCITCFY